MKKIVEGVSDTKLQEIENKLSKRNERSPLRLHHIESINHRSVENLLNKILAYNISHPTVYVKSGSMQCRRNCNRSAGDLYIIAKYYRPSVTLKEVRQALFILCNDFRVGSFYCHTIHKRVFFKLNQSLTRKNTYTSSGLSRDEFGLPLFWNDGQPHESNLVEFNMESQREDDD